MVRSLVHTKLIQEKTQWKSIFLLLMMRSLKQIKSLLMSISLSLTLSINNFINRLTHNKKGYASYTQSALQKVSNNTVKLQYKCYQHSLNHDLIL